MTRAAFLSFISVILALLIAAPSAGATEQVWSALVLATNEKSPKDAPPELSKYKGKLSRIFGYNQFEIVGSHTETMDAPDERWLVPGQEFSMKVWSKEESKSGYLLQMYLYRDKKLLVDTETKLGAGSPLFIRGPLYGRGQLILILLVKQP